MLSFFSFSVRILSACLLFPSCVCYVSLLYHTSRMGQPNRWNFLCSVKYGATNYVLVLTPPPAISPKENFLVRALFCIALLQSCLRFSCSSQHAVRLSTASEVLLNASNLWQRASRRNDYEVFVCQTINDKISNNIRYLASSGIK